MPEFSNNTLYYNAEEAARELDRSAPEIESLILSGRLQTEIVDGKRVIPAQALEDFHAGISLPDIKARVILEEGNNDRLVEPDQIAILPENSDAVESHNADPEGTYYYSPSQAAELLSTNLLELNTLVARGELPAASIVEMLSDELRNERELNQRLAQELKQERADYAQDIQNARYEIDQSNAEIENLRRDYAIQSEALQEDLEVERNKRIDSELRAEELQDQLEEEHRPRTGVKGVVESLKGLISYEDDDEEEQRRDLELALEHSKRELEEEQDRQRKNKELFGDLQSKLERNEARNRELENALSSEMGKTLRLEEDKRILDEIRRVLGADISRPSEHVEAATPVDTRREEPDNTNNELLIDTQYGEWIFRPPFALEEDEIELLRLVAGEDEITAEQIRRKTDRRRATDNLDDLLDRLADESLEPIKEINDRYSFDPNFLQD